MPEFSPEEWDDFLSTYPDSHILQTSPWGEFKSNYGWQVIRVVVGDSGTQVMFRRLPFGFSWAYIPKGPIGDCWDDLLLEVDRLCLKNRTVFLKVEPDIWSETNQRLEDIPPSGFRLSHHSIQPARTIVVDLQGTEEQLMARMKQKTRYNIRLAGRKGVIVSLSDDLSIFSRLMQDTGERNNFKFHTPDYYQYAYNLFHPLGECEFLYAIYQEKPLAGLMVFTHGKRAWYFYGASSNIHRNLMPAYLLQWEAIRWAKERGCTEYDLWGVPDADYKTLEKEFESRRDGLWSVYRNKRGYGGQLKRSHGPWDRVYTPVLYSFYKWWFGRRNS